MRGRQAWPSGQASWPFEGSQGTEQKEGRSHTPSPLLSTALGGRKPPPSTSTRIGLVAPQANDG
jgi:hypothetical protein